MALNINTVTVLGANGTMGKLVVGMFAAFGNCKVYAVCRSRGDAERVPYQAASSVRAGSVANHVVPCDYTDLDECVSNSDLVFDSTAENVAVKLGVLRSVLPYLMESALVCSGTSGLSITNLADALGPDVRDRFFGVHLFNPPYSMRLCELIVPRGASRAQLSSEDDLERYLTDVLFRHVIRTDDTPAFLGNRIGFQLINRSMQLASEFSDRGGIDYIDAILGTFTGRAMAPLTTADFVGLDTCAAIVDNIVANAPDDPFLPSFELPAFCRDLIAVGALGRKTPEAGGLFKRVETDEGERQTLVYDIQSSRYREPQAYELSFARAMKESIRTGDYAGAARALVEDAAAEGAICRNVLADYLSYAAVMGSQVSEGIAAADTAMASGFNWCPPQGMAEFVSLALPVRQFLAENASESLSSDAEAVARHLEGHSAYDYRRYFRAR